jgi:hypothetical protein
MERRHLPPDTSYPIRRPQVNDGRPRTIGQVMNTDVSQQGSELRAEKPIGSSLPMTRPPQAFDRHVPPRGSTLVPTMNTYTGNPFVPSATSIGESQGSLEKKPPSIAMQPMDPLISPVPMTSTSHDTFGAVVPPSSLSRFMPQEPNDRMTYHPRPSPTQSMAPSIGMPGPPQNPYQGNLASISNESAYIPAPSTINAARPDTFEVPRSGMIPSRLQESVQSARWEEHVSPISREETNLPAPPPNVNRELTPI